MEQKNEALYLINGDKFLHLRENGAGVGFATYDCATGEPQEFGQISKLNLPPDGRNAIPAARNWYLFELSSDDRKAIQEVSLQHLDTIPQSGVRRRRIWDDPTIPRDDVRLINSHYDDLYRVPNHGVVQVDRSDDSSYTARVEHLDDYHFDLGEYGNVYHIAQFGEMMERNGSTAYPEIQTQDEQGAWELGGKGYLAIQSCENGWDYTIYHSDFSVMDGGQLDEPELTIQEVREEILTAYHMEKGRRVLKDYDLIIDKVAETEEQRKTESPLLDEELQEIELFGKPALFSNSRLLDKDVPEGLYRFDLRGSDYDPEYPLTVEKNVVVNHAASVLLTENLDLGEQARLLLGEDGLNFTGELKTVREFLTEQSALEKSADRPSVLKMLKEKCDAPECSPSGCRKARDAHEL